MVLKDTVDVKPGFLSYFHADLIQSLMQGLGKQGKGKDKKKKGGGGGGGDDAPKRGIKSLPHLNLTKVKKGGQRHGSSRRDPSTYSARRENSLACTALQKRKTDAQLESMTLRTPRKIDIVFENEVGKQKNKQDSNTERHQEKLAGEQLRPYQQQLIFQALNCAPIVHVDRRILFDVDDRKVEEFLSLREPCDEPPVSASAGKEERVKDPVVVPRIDEPEAPKPPGLQDPEAQPEVTPRKQKLKFTETKDAAKKMVQKTARLSEKVVTKCSPKQQQTIVKPLVLPEASKSSVPIGFGGEPAECPQTSRPSKIVLAESTPRLAQTDRIAHQPCADATMQQLALQTPSKGLETLMTPDAVLKQYPSCLTDFEKKEILKYPEIYYIGVPQKKIQAVEGQGKFNHGFDTEKGDYNAIVQDHIAYRYEILGKLGKGSFGQVFKCVDHKFKVTRAIKIIRNKKQFTQQAFIEIHLLEFLRNKAVEEGADYNIVTIYESFEFRGHLCLSFAVHDISLFDMLKKNNFEGFNLSVVKCFAKQVLVSLQFLHRSRIIHGDLKPENILIQHASSPKIKLIDFGSSCFEHERIYTYIQSRFYRAPEVILGLPYDMMIDVWSFACILAELFTGYPLFPGEDEVEQLAYMMEVLGTPPLSLINQAKRKKMFFDSENKPRIVPNSSGTRHFPSTKDLRTAVGCSDKSFISFLSCCLKWDKEQRMTPQDLLKHDWITQIQPLSDVVRYVRPKKRLSKSVKKPSLKQTKPGPPGYSAKAH